MIKIAIAKGYLWDKAYQYLTDTGLRFPYDIKENRKLSVMDTNKTITLLCVRSWDVPAYVEEGAADLGIVGKDVLNEQTPNVAELIDLKFGHCQLVLAGLSPKADQLLFHNIRVATKYIRSTTSYFRQSGLNIQPIPLYGAIELAPVTGLSDIICDLMATGQTLKDNGLHILDTVFDSTARLIANNASMCIAYQPIMQLTQALSTIVNRP